MKIKIKGETHGEAANEEFLAKAKKLAEEGRIILVLENKIFDDYKDGLIEKNIYAIEDKIIWEYNCIICALNETYPILRKNKDLGNKSLLDLFIEMSEDNTVEKKVNDCLAEYTESYCSFLCNTTEKCPVWPILKKLLDRIIERDGRENPLLTLFQYVSDRKEKKEYEITKREIDLVKKNLPFFNEALKLSAKLFAEHIRDNNYSDTIKAHQGVSEEWIDAYFAFELVRLEGQSLLDFDTVCVDLRNQLFVEQLAKIASNNGDGIICFIVGEAHAEGVKRLFSEQYSANHEIEIIGEDKKTKTPGPKP